jgi:RNA polymerase sigma-70 factor (ECF subfamily)
VFWVFAQRLERVPPAAERSFLISTAFRIAADRKRLRWNRSVTEPLDVDLRAEDGPSPDEVVDLHRARALLDEALEGLTSDERSVFVLTEIEQMTRSEIARALDIPEGTVANRLRRARETFERALKRLQSRGRKHR